MLGPEPPAYRSEPESAPEAPAEPEAPALEPEPPTFREAPPARVAAAFVPAEATPDAPVVPPPSIAAAVGAAPAVPLSGSAGAAPVPGAQPSKIERRLAQLAPETTVATGGPAIGVADAQLFDCPACGRPLARGTSRCTNCGTRLIGGRPFRRVATFAAVAIVAVLILGGVGMTVMAMSAAQPPTGTGPTGSPAASRPAATAETPSQPPTPVGVPAEAAAALSGTAVVNARIATDAGTLARTLSDKSSQTIDIARAMRALGADAQLGLDMTGRLTPWTDAAPVTAKLVGFYRSLADSTRDALRASLTDATSYRRAGAQLLSVIRGLDAVDAASRELAAGVGLSLPPLRVPSAGSAAPSK